MGSCGGKIGNAKQRKEKPCFSQVYMYRVLQDSLPAVLCHLIYQYADESNHVFILSEPMLGTSDPVVLYRVVPPGKVYTEAQWKATPNRKIGREWLTARFLQSPHYRGDMPMVIDVSPGCVWRVDCGNSLCVLRFRVGEEQAESPQYPPVPIEPYGGVLAYAPDEWLIYSGDTHCAPFAMLGRNDTTSTWRISWQQKPKTIAAYRRMINPLMFSSQSEIWMIDVGRHTSHYCQTYNPIRDLWMQKPPLQLRYERMYAAVMMDQKIIICGIPASPFPFSDTDNQVPDEEDDAVVFATFVFECYYESDRARRGGVDKPGTWRVMHEWCRNVPCFRREYGQGILFCAVKNVLVLCYDRECWILDTCAPLESLQWTRTSDDLPFKIGTTCSVRC